MKRRLPDEFFYMALYQVSTINTTEGELLTHKLFYVHCYADHLIQRHFGVGLWFGDKGMEFEVTARSV
jgi:hypothetical protein